MSECCTSVLSLASHPFNICPCWPCLLQIRDAVQARAGQGLIIRTTLCNAVSDVFCLVTNFSDKTFIFFPDKNHGVILIPEGIVESIHELYALLKVT